MPDPFENLKQTIDMLKPSAEVRALIGSIDTSLSELLDELRKPREAGAVVAPTLDTTALCDAFAAAFAKTMSTQQAPVVNVAPVLRSDWTSLKAVMRNQDGRVMTLNITKEQ